MEYSLSKIKKKYMKTQIVVEAEMTDEQCDALVSEIRQICSYIGIKIAIAPFKMTESIVNNVDCDCSQYDAISQGFGKPMYCSNCLKEV